MANEYASLASLKTSLTITDADRDALLMEKLTSASRSIDRDTGRRFWLDSSAVVRTFNPLGITVSDRDGEHLLVPDIGSSTGFMVETGKAGSWTDVTSSVELTPINALIVGRPHTSLLYVGRCWPKGNGFRVRVTARFGWPEIPADIIEATLIQANRFWKRKDSPEGVTGSAEWGVVRLARQDPDVYSLIKSYILPGMA